MRNLVEDIRKVVLGAFRKFRVPENFFLTLRLSALSSGRSVVRARLEKSPRNDNRLLVLLSDP